jgi:putative chitinase
VVRKPSLSCENADGHAYEGRKDLGNTETGDGPKFRGRGLIQITGRANYTEAGRELGLDLIAHPDLLEELDNAASASAWWWWKRHLSEIADKNDETAFARITRVINGGVNGWTSRLAYWQRAKRVLEA